MNTREYTFQGLFGSSFEFEGGKINLSKIEIPIIQRDYAQGRMNEEVNRIRERFLDALFQAIIKNNHITLDFVYGDVSSDGVLTPLDGQQRLTTLYLLHLYSAKKEKIELSECNFLNHFSYSTRFSSRDFCKELVKYSPDFNKDVLSTEIKNQAWYPYEWKNDPTIQSMLVMLNAIHKKFKNIDDLWKKLVTSKIISFYFLPLTEMGLTDELYIKMNSRGKPLTAFEHFKAEFEEIIKQVSSEYSAEINHKFDIDWTDILYPFRGSNKTIDDEFMRYFHFISDIVAYKSNQNIVKDDFEVARLLYSIDNNQAKDNILFLKNSFDCWSNLDIPSFFNRIFSRDSYQRCKVKIYQNDLNIFKECLENYGEYSGRNRKFPLNKMLLLYSVITYLQNSVTISENQFHRRIRIIRNLIWNSNDEIRDERMKTLLKESEQIILTGEIPTAELGELGYNERQKEEERKKNLWLQDNTGKEDELFHLEDHTLLKGCISIIDMDSSNNFNKFRLLFNNCSKELINNALLSIGDYSQLISWRFQLGAMYNDSVWFDLFHPTKQRKYFEYTHQTINKLLFILDESKIDNETLKVIIKEYLENPGTPKDWRYYLVKYRPMREGRFGMYYWKKTSNKNYEIIMMNTEKSLSGKNWNIFLYTLYGLPDYSGMLSLGDYAYQGDRLKIIYTDYVIECQNDKYVVYHEGTQKAISIEQKNGIDVEDRIELGKQILSGLLPFHNK